MQVTLVEGAQSTSAVLEELDNELMAQIAGEIKARRALLTRAVARTESLLHEMYAVRANDLKSGHQVHDEIVAYSTSEASHMCQQNCQYVQVQSVTRDLVRLGIPCTPLPTCRGGHVAASSNDLLLRECAKEQTTIRSASKGPPTTPPATHRARSASKARCSGQPAIRDSSLDRTPFLATPRVTARGSLQTAQDCPSDRVQDALVTGRTPERANLGDLSAVFTSRSIIQQYTNGQAHDALTPKGMGYLIDSHGDAQSTKLERQECSSFVISNAHAWNQDLEQEFKSRGVADSDMVVVRDANGCVIDDMSVKDFMIDSSIPCLPGFPLNIACSKTVDGNVCVVSSLSSASRSAFPRTAQDSKRKKTPPDVDRSVLQRQATGGLRETISKFLRSGSGSTNDASSHHSKPEVSAGTEMSNSEADEFEFWPTWKEEAPDQSEATSPKRLGSNDDLEMDTGSLNGSTYGARQSVYSAASSGVALYISSSRTDEDACGCVQRHIMLRPTSMKCILWDTLKALALLYDLIFIPLSTFPLPKSHVFKINDAIIACLFLLDIYMSFLRGYIDIHGFVQMQARKVALRYCRTWLLFDSLAVALHIFILTKQMGSYPDSHGFVLTLLEWLRLIRVTKLPFLLNRNSELLGLKASTEKWLFVARILKLLMVFLLINHFISCGWYAIGQPKNRFGTPWFGPEGWLDEHFDGSSHISYRYTTSFHWSLTQFTPASMEVTPTNSVERLYNVFIIVCGFVMFSSFVSTMTQSIAQLQQASLAEKNAMQELRRFIADNSLSAETIGKIMSLLHEGKRAVRRKKLHEEEIKVLEQLPHGLRQQIRVEMYRPVLQTHPLMEKLQCWNTGTTCFKWLCRNALSEKSVMRGEALFSFGTEASGMYFVIDGTLHYHLGYDHAIEEVLLGEGGRNTRVCEAALWVRWLHRGRLVGETPSELILLGARRFAEICSHSSVIRELQAYARLFAKIALDSHGSASSIKDTWCNDQDAEALVRHAFPSRTATWSEGSQTQNRRLGWTAHLLRMGTRGLP